MMECVTVTVDPSVTMDLGDNDVSVWTHQF